MNSSVLEGYRGSLRKEKRDRFTGVGWQALQGRINPLSHPQYGVRQWSLSFHHCLLLNADFLLYVSIPAWEYDITSMRIGYCVQKSFFGYTFCAEFFTMYFMFPLLFKQCSLTFVDLRLRLQTVILQGLEVIDICRLLAPSAVWIL